MKKTTRTYLDVPFEDNDTVSALGAKFCGVIKKWYVPRRKRDDAFARWIPRGPVSVVADPAYPVPVKVYAYQEPPRGRRR